MIYLLRHGLDDERYIGGWSDGDLLDEGKKQVYDTALFLQKEGFDIRKIISSDVKRAMTTSLIVQSVIDKDIILDSRLRELDKGLLTGLSVTYALEKYPSFVHVQDINLTYPEGESMLSFYYKIRNLLETFILKQDHVLLVTHRGVINMLYFLLNHQELNMDKGQFGVTHASLHALDTKNKTLVKIR